MINEKERIRSGGTYVVRIWSWIWKKQFLQRFRNKVRLCGLVFQEANIRGNMVSCVIVLKVCVLQELESVWVNTSTNMSLEVVEALLTTCPRSK